MGLVAMAMEDWVECVVTATDDWAELVAMAMEDWAESIVAVSEFDSGITSFSVWSCSVSDNEPWWYGLRTPHTAQLVILETRWASIGEKPRPLSQSAPASWDQEQRWWQQRAITIPLSLDDGSREVLCVQVLLGSGGPDWRLSW